LKNRKPDYTQSNLCRTVTCRLFAVPVVEMGEVGKGTYCDAWLSKAKEETHGEP
jgi:hypothetical protein